MRSVLAWVRARIEVSVPLLAVPTFFAMLEFTQGEVKAWQSVLVYGLALFFGVYHITPLSGISTFSASSPITTVLTAFSMGLIMGIIYRYRGLTTAILVHGLGDWEVIMLLGSAGA
jgi:hypothetical protein